MTVNYYNTINHIDLNLYYCGTQQCDPGHYWGPAIKEHFKIHFIHKGKGLFKVCDKTYYLQEGNGFLICPNTVSYYKADDEDPWSYSWVAFNGLHAELYLERADLSVKSPIFKYDTDNAMNECFKQMIESSNLEKGNDLEFQSLLYHFFAILIDRINRGQPDYKPAKQKEAYIEKVIEFIQINYSHRISVSEIADYIGLDRKYLSSLFKSVLETNLQDYLIEFRLNRACELMKDTHLAIGDISRSVGYDDPLLFSKMFKKFKGISPRYFRNNINLIP